MRQALQEEGWSFIFDLPIDDAVERFQYTILAKAREYIPMRWFSEAKGQHPWLNTRCREAIAKKHAAEGSVDYLAARDFCSDILYDEYRKHIARTKLLLQDCVRGSRKW